jgi:protein-tyrosine phosphatase
MMPACERPHEVVRRELDMVRICFVCLGNICRSPTAEGVMQALVRKRGLADHIEIESAGTGGWHVGEPADPRSRAVARARGIELTSTACQFTAADFDRFDYVLAMDRSNRYALLAMARNQTDRGKIHLLRSFDPSAPGDADVPDPYYGGARGFDDVLDMCERACNGLLEHLFQHHEHLRRHEPA